MTAWCNHRYVLGYHRKYPGPPISDNLPSLWACAKRNSSMTVLKEVTYLHKLVLFSDWCFWLTKWILHFPNPCPLQEERIPKAPAFYDSMKVAVGKSISGLMQDYQGKRWNASNSIGQYPCAHLKLGSFLNPQTTSRKPSFHHGRLYWFLSCWLHYVFNLAFCCHSHSESLSLVARDKNIPNKYKRLMLHFCSIVHGNQGTGQPAWCCSCSFQAQLMCRHSSLNASVGSVQWIS